MSLDRSLDCEDPERDPSGPPASFEHPVKVRRAYTDCRFGQMHYLEGRPAVARAPTLVLLHQNPSSSAEYEGLLRSMARDRRVIAFDTPGYGMSAPPSRPLPIADYVAAFSDALDALSLTVDGPIDVFGYHTGALLAAELGLQRPDAVGRMVLSGVPMRTADECAQRLAAARASPVPTEDGAALMAQSAVLWRYVVTQRAPGVSLEAAAALFAIKNQPLHHGWWIYEGVWTYPVRERFPRITQPCLVLQPHDDLLRQSREACALVPGGVFVEAPDLDRDIFELGVERIAAAMREFLCPIPETVR